MEIVIDKYTALKIMEYKGAFRIEVGNNKNGKWYAKKIRKQEWDDDKKVFEYTDKERNLSIPLGNYQDAAVRLKTLAAMLDEAASAVNPPAQEQGDVPF
jgi:hypothetical protein